MFGDRVDFDVLVREDLTITAFEQARDYGQHFKDYYGPTIVARKNAVANGREDDFDAAVDAFCDEWNRSESARRASSRSTS